MTLIVGKHALESLTTGMYSDERVIYREYIQNAIDSIDNAIREGIIASENARIDISILADDYTISIRDNGMGISIEKAYNVLGNVGKSEKDYRKEAGFRGIGRLGGLSYCDQLVFETTYKGEPTKTIITWDCIKLKELLVPGIEKDMGVIELIQKVMEKKEKPEKEDEHYFEVKMIGINSDILLDFDGIKQYLSQVAPVPFDYSKFADLKKISEKLKELDKELFEYRIFIESETVAFEQIFKPYKRSMRAGDSNENDYIQEIVFFDSYKNDGSLFFLGWYGLTNLSGAVKQEENVRGIRARKHNIQIGNERTLREFFGNNPTYREFYKWFVGEVYIFENDLIPNARRDDFEKNNVYYLFKAELEKTTKELARLPHKASKERSEDKIIKRAEAELTVIERELDKGITEHKKIKLIAQLEQTENKLKRISGRKTQKEVYNSDNNEEEKRAVKDETLLKKKDNLLDHIENKKREIGDSKNYKAKRIPASYPKNIRKIIQLVFEVIDEVLTEENAQELQERIIEELESLSKKNY